MQTFRVFKYQQTDISPLMPKVIEKHLWHESFGFLHRRIVYNFSACAEKCWPVCIWHDWRIREAFPWQSECFVTEIVITAYDRKPINLLTCTNRKNAQAVVMHGRSLLYRLVPRQYSALSSCAQAVVGFIVWCPGSSRLYLLVPRQ